MKFNKYNHITELYYQIIIDFFLLIFHAEIKKIRLYTNYLLHEENDNSSLWPQNLENQLYITIN